MQKLDLQDECIPIYPSRSLPSSQDMTSFRVVLSIWHSYISRSKYDRRKIGSADQLIAVFGLDINYEKESDELVKCLNTLHHCIQFSLFSDSISLFTIPT